MDASLMVADGHRIQKSEPAGTGSLAPHHLNFKNCQPVTGDHQLPTSSRSLR
jgi:hypothetical protein